MTQAMHPRTPKRRRKNNFGKRKEKQG